MHSKSSKVYFCFQIALILNVFQTLLPSIKCAIIFKVPAAGECSDLSGIQFFSVLYTRFGLAKPADWALLLLLCPQSHLPSARSQASHHPDL